MYVDGVLKDLYQDVKKAINFYYDRNIHIITLKKIRRYLDIDALDRSKINFIWRILQHFESKGYLILIKQKPTKQYKIAKFPIINNIAIGNEKISLSPTFKRIYENSNEIEKKIEELIKQRKKEDEV